LRTGSGRRVGLPGRGPRGYHSGDFAAAARPRPIMDSRHRAAQGGSGPVNLLTPLTLKWGSN